MKRKVLVIGLDGARLDILLKWCKEGYLPNINKIIKEGVYGKLESVYPIHSIPAWVSFFTGKSPANHGIYDILIKKEKNEYYWRPVCRYDIHGEAIWEILSNYGYIVGTIGFPVTYPPKRINGIWISGWDTPSEFHKYTYPKELLNMLKSMGYKPTLAFDPTNEEKFIRELYKQVEIRFKIAKWFMNNYNWDGLFLMINTTEILHHKFSPFIDSSHPLFKEKFEKIVREHYDFIDKKIGELLNNIDNKETYIFIVSDHGFAPFYGKIYINNFLKKHKLIKLKRNYIKRINFKVLSFLKKNGVILYPFLPKFLKKMATIKYRSFEWIYLKELIDISKTLAYTPIPNGQIYINTYPSLNDSEYYHLRKCIKKIIESDPKLKSIIKLVEKERIYDKNSKFFKMLPDLYIIFNEKLYKIEIDPTHYNIIEPVSSFDYPKEDIGYHTLHGVIIAKGPDIKMNVNITNNIKPKIIDITPTILHIFGVSLPKDLDGRVLKEIFDEKSELYTRKVYDNNIDEKIKLRLAIKKLKKKNI